MGVDGQAPSNKEQLSSGYGEARSIVGRNSHESCGGPVKDMGQKVHLACSSDSSESRVASQPNCNIQCPVTAVFDSPITPAPQVTSHISQISCTRDLSDTPAATRCWPEHHGSPKLKPSCQHLITSELAATCLSTCCDISSVLSLDLPIEWCQHEALY